jgi:hypothetical protein
MGSSDSRLKNDPGLFGAIVNNVAQRPGELIALIQTHQGDPAWALGRVHRSSGYTPLTLACSLDRGNALDVVQQLLAAGADPTILDRNSHSPMRVASAKKSHALAEQMVRMLLSVVKQRDVARARSWSLTCCVHALTAGNDRLARMFIIEELCFEGADQNIVLRGIGRKVMQMSRKFPMSNAAVRLVKGTLEVKGSLRDPTRRDAVVMRHNKKRTIMIKPNGIMLIRPSAWLGLKERREVFYPWSHNTVLHKHGFPGAMGLVNNQLTFSGTNSRAQIQLAPGVIVHIDVEDAWGLLDALSVAIGLVSPVYPIRYAFNDFQTKFLKLVSEPHTLIFDQPANATQQSVRNLELAKLRCLGRVGEGLQNGFASQTSVLGQHVETLRRQVETRAYNLQMLQQSLPVHANPNNNMVLQQQVRGHEAAVKHLSVLEGEFREAQGLGAKMADLQASILNLLGPRNATVANGLGQAVAHMPYAVAANVNIDPTQPMQVQRYNEPVFQMNAMQQQAQPQNKIMSIHEHKNQVVSAPEADLHYSAPPAYDFAGTVMPSASICVVCVGRVHVMCIHVYMFIRVCVCAVMEIPITLNGYPEDLLQQEAAALTPPSYELAVDLAAEEKYGHAAVQDIVKQQDSLELQMAEMKIRLSSMPPVGSVMAPSFGNPAPVAQPVQPVAASTPAPWMLPVSSLQQQQQQQSVVDIHRRSVSVVPVPDPAVVVEQADPEPVFVGVPEPVEPVNLVEAAPPVSVCVDAPVVKLGEVELLVDGMEEKKEERQEPVLVEQQLQHPGEAEPQEEEEEVEEEEEEGAVPPSIAVLPDEAAAVVVQEEVEGPSVVQEERKQTIKIKRKKKKKKKKAVVA